ncbi:hypothetical protein CIPAW_01G021800 [Carya illinoinensis]|uniref:Uncharacterized protein n=1 Tax=Carya illinoinensis TaxID=32201 RepID=A0A8T1RFM0_CARIL|nr:hypothetical protein CIPAW_01G021800 [Carya illinoinensis]
MKFFLRHSKYVRLGSNFIHDFFSFLYLQRSRWLLHGIRTYNLILFFFYY